MDFSDNDDEWVLDVQDYKFDTFMNQMMAPQSKEDFEFLCDSHRYLIDDLDILQKLEFDILQSFTDEPMIDYIADRNLTISQKLKLTNKCFYEYKPILRQCSICNQMNVIASKPKFMNRCNICFFK